MGCKPVGVQCKSNHMFPQSSFLRNPSQAFLTSHFYAYNIMSNTALTEYNVTITVSLGRIQHALKPLQTRQWRICAIVPLAFTFCQVSGPLRQLQHYPSYLF